MDEMTDDRLDALLADLRQHWRRPAELPGDALWERIEAAHFDARAARRPAHTVTWRTLGVGLAATLVLGVGIGRWSVRPAPTPAAPAFAAQERAPGPISLATTEYLGETAALLTALPRDARESEAGDARFAVQARELLSTTRLLLDSRAAEDPRLRGLLEDLELVLAQIARLPARRGGEELQLIREALEQRDVVPRLHLVAAEVSASGD
jgi:hypothetical protein